MASNEQGADGLPTAEVISVNKGKRIRTVEVADYTYDLLEIGDELLRRSDVADLIQDKIQDLRRNIDSQPDDVIRSRQIRAVNELQKLSDEVNES